MYHVVNNKAAAAHLTIFLPVAQSLNKGKMLLGNFLFRRQRVFVPTGLSSIQYFCITIVIEGACVFKMAFRR